MKRRSMLRFILGAAVSAAARAGASPPGVSPREAPRRIVSLDWGLGEMLLSIGVVPVGLANTKGFRVSFTTSALPASVVDLGLMFQPNMELLLALKPDLILITPAHASLRASLERIAPTYTLGRFRAAPAPYTVAREETMQLARLLDREREAVVTLDDAQQKIASARDKLTACLPGCDQPLHVAQFLDETRIRVFGTQSMYGEMLTMLGLRNAWQGASSAATLGYDALGSARDTTLVCLTPIPFAAQTMMQSSPLWHAMGFAAPGRTVALPLIPPGGGVISATHFADALADSLLNAAKERA